MSVARGVKRREVASKRKTAKKNVAWNPLPNSSQISFLLTGKKEFLIKEVLYHGGRGFGKSECLIVAYLQHVGKGYGSRWTGVILRREIKSLKDLISKSYRIINVAFPGAVFNKTQRCWTFPGGEKLYFDFCKTESDYEQKHHGNEYQFIGFDELSTWESDAVYSLMKTCLRTRKNEDEYDIENDNDELEEVYDPDAPPLQVRATTNPYGRGKGWVKDYFIDRAPVGEIVYRRGRPHLMHIKGSVYENIRIIKSYIEELECEPDPVKKAAYLYGDWNSIDIAAIFGYHWSENTVIEPFEIPSSWTVYRSYDDGTASPFAMVWTAEADGTEVTLKDGSKFRPPSGSIIVLAEDYGTEEKNGKQVRRNKGLNMSARPVARRLLKREADLCKGLLRNSKILPGPADTSINAGKNIDKGTHPTVFKEMRAEGLKFIDAYKANGSREVSAGIMIERLDATKKQDYSRPHIYFFNTCKYSIKFLPELNRHPDKPGEVAKGPDDHLWDALAYRLTMKAKGKVTGLNPF